MTKHHDPVLFYFSRIAIIVPVVVLVLGLIIKVVPKQFQSENLVQPTTVPSQSSTSETSSAQKIDFSKSYICQTNTKDSSQSAYLKQKRIYMQTTNLELNKSDYLLYRDGCLYRWEKGTFAGQKTCGLAQYFSIFESLYNAGLVDIDNLFSYLSNFQQATQSATTSSKEEKVKNLLNTCKQAEIKNEAIFVIPKNILFKTQAVEDLKF